MSGPGVATRYQAGVTGCASAPVPGTRAPGAPRAVPSTCRAAPPTPATATTRIRSGAMDRWTARMGRMRCLAVSYSSLLVRVYPMFHPIPLTV